jgi:hypothetical protein
MFYAASLSNSRANINRVSCQKLLSLRHLVIACLRVDQAVAAKDKILLGHMNLSKLKKQLV